MPKFGGGEVARVDVLEVAGKIQEEDV